MIYRNPRLELTDTPMSAIVKMSEGNPGALRVCLELFNKGPAIDPDAAFGGFANLFSLDTHDIYGARIWQLYKDVCRQDLTRVVGLLRAVQLGFMPEHQLHNWIQVPPDEFAVDGYVDMVRERLPRFGRIAA